MLILIDNYDSFTYNLVHYAMELGADVKVFRNDKISVDEVLAKNPSHIIISPGPSDPAHAGICLDLVKENQKVPLLGVCLGHQTIGQAFGGKVVRAHEPIHGKTSKINHNSKGVFEGISSPFLATRYHSLIVEKASLPEVLEVTAETDDGIIMGLSHKKLPIYGVQFHPESIASEHGHAIMRNFLKL
jgi:anthranilate synthase component 2